MSYYVVASCEDSIPRERLQPLHERVSLLARKQGGAPLVCFDFTKRETPHLGWRACTSPEAARRLCAGSRLPSFVSSFLVPPLRRALKTFICMLIDLIEIEW